MKIESIDNKINKIENIIGTSASIKTKKISIGKNPSIQGAVIYIDGLVDKNIINRDILNPLMLGVHNSILLNKNTASFLCSSYITAESSIINGNTADVFKGIKSGNTLLLIENVEEFILIDTAGGKGRSVSDPANETALRGSRDGFVENVEINISLIRRRIKDTHLSVENLIVGRRTQTEIALVYINDLVDNEVLNELRKRINAIDVDSITGSGAIEQYIDENPYSIFPMFATTERVDRAVASIMEGRITIVVGGSPFVITLPTLFIEFLHTVEDYNEKVVFVNSVRILRLIAVFISVTLPSIYLTLIKFNAELVPIEFVIPIVQSRIGISLSPFMEILILDVLMEFLREGGLRLPTKIAQTLSIVGGIIIGNAAVDSKIVSPSTLLVIGITIVASFLIPNVDMSISLRLLRFPMLFISNLMGIFGIAAGYTFLIIYLSSIENFGVPYMTFSKDELKDSVTRASLWKMDTRPSQISNKDIKRQTNFTWKFRRKEDE